MSIYNVVIHYGPCIWDNVLVHKPQKLSGVKDALLKLGYRVTLRPIPEAYACIFEMCSYQVFKCNVNNLQFNRPVSVDPVGQKAVSAVVEATERLSHGQTYLWCWELLQNAPFEKNVSGLKNYWPLPVDNTLTPKTKDCEESCILCCGSLPIKDIEEEGRENLDIIGTVHKNASSIIPFDENEINRQIIDDELAAREHALEDLEGGTLKEFDELDIDTKELNS